MKSQWASDRNLNLFRRVLEGETLDAVAIEHGITRERARQIVNQVRIGAIGALPVKEQRKWRIETSRLPAMRVHREFLYQCLTLPLVKKPSLRSQVDRQMGE